MSKKNKYRSGFEKTIANLFKEARVRFKYEPDRIPYTISRTYTPDFKIGKIYIEAKGFFKSSDRTKMKLVKEQHPHLDIRMWFMADNWMTKAKKQRYTDWAFKNGFPYHVGKDFPHHWFDKK